MKNTCLDTGPVVDRHGRHPPPERCSGVPAPVSIVSATLQWPQQQRAGALACVVGQKGGMTLTCGTFGDSVEGGLGIAGQRRIAPSFGLEQFLGCGRCAIFQNFEYAPLEHRLVHQARFGDLAQEVVSAPPGLERRCACAKLLQGGRHDRPEILKRAACFFAGGKCVAVKVGDQLPQSLRCQHAFAAGHLLFKKRHRLLRLMPPAPGFLSTPGPRHPKRRASQHASSSLAASGWTCLLDGLIRPVTSQTKGAQSRPTEPTISPQGENATE